MKGRKSVSVVIPTLNSSRHLGTCLESVKWANEIIIVDMGSTDETLQMAKSYHARVFIKRPNDGNFDKNRQFGMRLAKSDWILKLDSDEELSSDLQLEILEFLRRDGGEVNGLYLRNKIFMFGTQIRNGPVKKNSNELRMMRNGCWQYNPYRYHQQIKVKGKTQFLKNYYYHYNFDSVAQFLEKTNKYTSLDAMFYGKSARVIDICLAPFKSFFKLFFLQVGFLEKKVGFAVCYLYSLYNLIEKIKAWESYKL